MCTHSTNRLISASIPLLEPHLKGTPAEQNNWSLTLTIFPMRFVDKDSLQNNFFLECTFVTAQHPLATDGLNTCRKNMAKHTSKRDQDMDWIKCISYSRVDRRWRESRTEPDVSVAHTLTTDDDGAGVVDQRCGSSLGK